MTIRMTGAVRAVLATLADTPGETSGYTLAHKTGFGSGTIYPLLGRLAGAGLVTVREESAEEHAAAVRGRPPRKYHTLTDAGRAFLAEREQPQRPPRGQSAASFTIQPPATADLDLAAGELAVTLTVPPALPRIALQSVTVRIERPDGRHTETTFHRTTTRRKAAKENP